MSSLHRIAASLYAMLSLRRLQPQLHRMPVLVRHVQPAPHLCIDSAFMIMLRLILLPQTLQKVLLSSSCPAIYAMSSLHRIAASTSLYAMSSLRCIIALDAACDVCTPCRACAAMLHYILACGQRHVKPARHCWHQLPCIGPTSSTAYGMNIHWPVMIVF